jgi:predicted secreted Zn-dependent protease
MMGGTEFLAVLVLVASAIETPVVEGVAVTQVVETYPVTGTTSRRLLDELNKNALVDEADGSRTYGRADVAVNWSYTYRTRSGVPCAVDSTQVKLDIKIRLPDWQPARTPSTAIGAQWQTFHDALTRHEVNHRGFGVEAARQIRETLAQLTAPTCDEVNAEADRQTGLIMKRMSEMNRAYDRETDHGRTEGAFWHAR